MNFGAAQVHVSPFFSFLPGGNYHAPPAEATFGDASTDMKPSLISPAAAAPLSFVELSNAANQVIHFSGFQKGSFGLLHNEGVRKDVKNEKIAPPSLDLVSSPSLRKQRVNSCCHHSYIWRDKSLHGRVRVHGTSTSLPVLLPPSAECARKPNLP